MPPPTRDGDVVPSSRPGQNLNRCAVGQCKYAFITDGRGGIINDPVLLRLAENHFWLSLADSDVLLWCKGVAYRLGLDVEITEPDVGPLQIQGPKSKEVMTDLFGADILDVPYYFMEERELNGMRMVISRTGYTGELGYELYLRDASRDGVKLWDAVIQAGEPHGLSPIGPCHIRRIEGGILAYGCDMTLDENPYEVGYGYKWMVELEQEQDFIGRDELRKIAEQGFRESSSAWRLAVSLSAPTAMALFPTSSRSQSAARRSANSPQRAGRHGSRRTSAMRWCRRRTPRSGPSSRCSVPRAPWKRSSQTVCSFVRSTPSKSLLAPAPERRADRPGRSRPVLTAPGPDGFRGRDGEGVASRLGRGVERRRDEPLALR